MALQTGDLYRGTLHWRMAGQECINTFSARINTGATIGSQINSILNGFMDRIQAAGQAFASIAHTSVYYHRIQVAPIRVRGQAYERSRDLDFYGQQPGELLPGLVAIPFFLHTDFAGRSRRGRLHVGGWTEEQQNAGVLTSTGANNAATVAAALNTILSHAGFPHVIYSRKIDAEGQSQPGLWWSGEEGAPGVPWARITNVTHTQLIGTMYSRKIGRGS